MRTGTIIGFIILLLIIVILGIGVFLLYLEVIDLRGQAEGSPSAPEAIDGRSVVNLDIDLQRGSLQIEPGETFSVRDMHNRPYRASVQGDTFVLDVDRWRHNNDIVLTLPADKTFEDVKISIGGGTLGLRDLSADKMKLSVGGGAITASEITARDLQLECGAGKIEFTGNVTEKLDIDHSVGETLVLLDGKESDFNYEVDYAVGSVRIGEREYSGISGSDSINNNADKNMTIDSSVGNLEVQFRGE
jgi:DUF4097 and DUF4098 domain-containing protein YvlB